MNKLHDVSQLEVGQSVVIADHYFGSVPRRSFVKVERITETTLVLSDGRTFSVSRSEWFSGKIGRERKTKVNSFPREFGVSLHFADSDEIALWDKQEKILADQREAVDSVKEFLAAGPVKIEEAKKAIEALQAYVAQSEGRI